MSSSPTIFDIPEEVLFRHILTVGVNCGPLLRSCKHFAHRYLENEEKKTQILESLFVDDKLFRKLHGQYVTFYVGPGVQSPQMRLPLSAPPCDTAEPLPDIHSCITYKHGKRHGLYTKWYENGNLKKRCTYKDGKLDGMCTRRYENGDRVDAYCGFPQREPESKPAATKPSSVSKSINSSYSPKHNGLEVLFCLVSGFISLGCLGLFLFFSVETLTSTTTYTVCNCTCFTEKWLSSREALEKNITVDDIEECIRFLRRRQAAIFCQISYKDHGKYYRVGSGSNPEWANACQSTVEVGKYDADVYVMSILFGCIAFICCCLCFAMAGCETLGEELERRSIV